MNKTTINTSRHGGETMISASTEWRAWKQAATGLLRSFFDRAASAAPGPGFEMMEPSGIAGEQDA